MDKLRAYYVELAERVCVGVTAEHYDRWHKWAIENHLTISPGMFISSITSLSSDKVSERIFPWHIEHGKRVNDEYKKIKIV